MVVYQDSGIYHHTVSYYDVGHISADFRYDAYDFMARDKLGMKQKIELFPAFRDLVQKEKEKNSQETWPGTRPKKKITNQVFFFSQRKNVGHLHKTNLGNMMVGATDSSIGDFLIKSRETVILSATNSTPDSL